ncbi:MAG: hypothetical protein QOF60_2420 [Actinomycetota bacterium]|jgi:type II secretory pathway component PulJ|nr:hypothetical protein [Actinomycetota bacterium]
MLKRLGFHSRSRDDNGTTVLEVTIVSALMLLVLAAFLGSLQSLTKSEQRASALVDNEQAVRFVLQSMAKDIRGANPMNAFTTKTTYGTQVQVETGTSSAKTVVRWVYDTASGTNYQTLRREVLSDNTATATVVSSVVRLRNVRNNTAGVALLGYYGESGRDLYSDASTTATDVGRCTIRMKLTIVSDSNPGPQPFQETVDVHLRNRLPGGLGCG